MKISKTETSLILAVLSEVTLTPDQENVYLKMKDYVNGTHHHFMSQMDQASRIVATWPAWKRNLLDNSPSGEARKPV